MEGLKKKNGLNSNQLKLIAIIAMTIDHLAWTLFPGTRTEWYVFALHIIGRLTAPIMWFFIAEGCHYTHDLRRYALRLLLFAVISHFAYCFAFGIEWNPLVGSVFNRTSVLWPLFLSVVLYGILKNERIPKWLQYLLIPVFCLLAFPGDWSSIAVMAPLCMCLDRDKKYRLWWIVAWTFVYALVYFIFLNKAYGVLQMFTFLSIPLLSQYNGKRGEWKGMKWLFYLYYPAHLLAVGILRLILHGNVPTIY